MVTTNPQLICDDRTSQQRRVGSGGSDTNCCGGAGVAGGVGLLSLRFGDGICGGMVVWRCSGGSVTVAVAVTVTDRCRLTD